MMQPFILDIIQLFRALPANFRMIILSKVTLNANFGRENREEQNKIKPGFAFKVYYFVSQLGLPAYCQ